MHLKGGEMRHVKTVCTLVVLGVVACFATGGKEWLKWQESLDLARPEDLDSRITAEKSIIFEGEPLLVSCSIKNITARDATIVPRAYNRIDALFTLGTEFSMMASDGVEYWYRTNVHIDVGMSPGCERVIAPDDSIYINGILWPDNFGEIKKLRPKRGLTTGDYLISCITWLGTKFYPKPSRCLRITSDTAEITIKGISSDDQKILSAVRPIMREFFGYGEEMDVSDSCRHIAYSLLDEIRKSDSYLAAYADFVYISMLAYEKAKNRFDEAIVEARKFIKAHKGTILGEEMEFRLVKMFHQREGVSKKFVEEAQRVMNKYPKNINSLELQNFLEKK